MINFDRFVTSRLLHKSDAPQSAKDITSKMSTNVDATTRLMDTLVALELLEKTKQGESWLYSNTDMAKQFLTKSSPDSVDSFVRFSNKRLYPVFGNLESVVREGSSDRHSSVDENLSPVIGRSLENRAL